MRFFRSHPRTALASLLVLLPACGSNSNEAFELGLTIETCSLGCSDGSLGPVSCGIQNISVNQAITVLFSDPVDFASVTKQTFRVSTTGGVAPAGEFLQGATPNEVIFRPVISFNSAGNPIFGLEANKTYEVLIPGLIQDPAGPWITGADGKPNANRLKCFVISSEPILDQTPGAPSVSVFVDQCTMQDTPGGTCIQVDTDVLANDGTLLTDVWRDSPITLRFDDIMNPATLINPVTGTSDFIDIKVDPDGNVSDATDQLPLFGTFTIDLDFDTNTTTVLFVPSTGMPSAGTNTMPRQVVVNFSSLIQDLGGNPLSNGELVSFIPELISFPPAVLPDGTGEDFSDAANEDTDRSGAKMWGTGAIANTLVPAVTGGSGRLGDLEVGLGEVLTLGTDGTLEVSDGMGGITTVQQIFGVGTDTATETYIDSYLIDNYDTSAAPPELPGTGLYSADDSFVGGPGVSGVFEFSNLIVRSGGRIVFVGDTPPRLITRGAAELQGTLDVRASDSANHKSNLGIGASGSKGGPGGGSGGKGGDRFDYAGTELLFVDLGGLLTDPDRSGIDNPGFSSLDGQAGEGVGGSSEGAGPGSLHWPQNFPGNQTGTSIFDGLIVSLGDFVSVPFFQCKSPQVNAPAGGGAYASDGLVGVAVNPGIPVEPDPLPYGPDTPGGDAASVTIGDLNPETGGLRGGSGGGGGGTHILNTKTNGLPQPCTTPIGSPDLMIEDLTDHSGAGGGGGGGAIQVLAGRSLQVSGTINASGGVGGGSDISTPQSMDFQRAAQAGGGGSGGAILLQSHELLLAAIAGRFDLRGGSGGRGPKAAPAGSGGAGVSRFELTSDSPQVLSDITDDVTNNLLINPPGIPNTIHSGIFVQTTTGASSMSGAQSCWMIPDGNFFEVRYDSDVVDLGTGDVITPGWDMDLVFTGGPPQSWRTTMTSGPMAGSSWEDLFGKLLRAPDELPAAMTNSPIVVRFQGVRAIAGVADKCTVQLSGPNSPVLPESLTPWVYHPVELTGDGTGNGYWDLVAATGAISTAEAAKRRPNMVRFQIVFDPEHPSFQGVVEGVTNLTINAQPD